MPKFLKPQPGFEPGFSQSRVRSSTPEPLRSTNGTLYGTSEQQTVDNARLQLFGKGKLGLEMLPPTRDALELHTARANYQAKIWLQADHEHRDIPSPTDISAWMMQSDCLKAVWTRLPPIPDACLDLVTCGCKAKCRTARCSCFKTNLSCTYACGVDGVDCCNPAGQQTWEEVNVTRYWTS